MKSTFDELKDLIDYIQSVYTEITDEWLRETPTKTNLKNALVADIDADGIIYKSIMEYVQLLNEKSADITLPLASVCSCKVTARVKAQNSIEFKIQNYKTELDPALLSCAKKRGVEPPRRNCCCCACRAT